MKQAKNSEFYHQSSKTVCVVHEGLKNEIKNSRKSASMLGSLLEVSMMYFKYFVEIDALCMEPRIS